MSLLFLIDTAETSIDLVFGYFQLFEELDVSLTKASERGVKIRLMTNSSTTNGMSYLNGNFASALKRLLVIGAESIDVSERCCPTNRSYDSTCTIVASSIVTMKIFGRKKTRKDITLNLVGRASAPIFSGIHHRFPRQYRQVHEFDLIVGGSWSIV